MTYRTCVQCGVSEKSEILAYREQRLVCSECDGDLENEWVAEDPENNQHYLDTFSPHGD